MLLHILYSKEFSGPNVHRAQAEKPYSNVHTISPDVSSLGPVSIIKKFFLKLNANLPASFSKLQSSTWFFHSPEAGTAALQKDHAGRHLRSSAAECKDEQSHVVLSGPTNTHLLFQRVTSSVDERKGTTCPVELEKGMGWAGLGHGMGGLGKWLHGSLLQGLFLTSAQHYLQAPQGF